MKNNYKYKGMWPVAPTPFHENGDVDYEGNMFLFLSLIAAN